MLRIEDPVGKQLLEAHALKAFAISSGNAFPFKNPFNDSDYVVKLCKQVPKKIENKEKCSVKIIEAEGSSFTLLDESANSTIGLNTTKGKRSLSML